MTTPVKWSNKKAENTLVTIGQGPDSARGISQVDCVELSPQADNHQHQSRWDRCLEPYTAALAKVAVGTAGSAGARR